MRGHSNVQGIGSMGFTPKLKQSIFDNLESRFNLQLPRDKGLDTLSCMESASEGRFDFAWNLGGNLFGSNPDSLFAQEALSQVDFVLYMNTTLNQGHFRGRGQTTLLLPVLARDEEPDRTTQESMFNFIRLSEGGKLRHEGPRSEGSIIAEVVARVFEDSPVPWRELHKNESVRELIGEIVPGFEKIKTIDESRDEFHIDGRILHTPQFPTADGRASFTACPLPHLRTEEKGNRHFKLMTVRSEGQFNTVVYDQEDRYRGVESRDVVFMNAEDIRSAGFEEGDRVTVENATGHMTGIELVAYPIKAGNIMMYYPEANVLVPRTHDKDSRTPSFKSVDVAIEK